MFTVAVLIIAMPGQARAQLTDQQREQLIEQVRTASDNLDVSRFPDLPKVRKEVRQRIEAVDRFLASRTSEENYHAWLDYLNMDALTEAMQQDESVNQIAREAIDLRNRLIGTDAGLEMQPLVELRRSLGQLVDAIVFRNPQQAEQALTRQLESLVERLQEMDSDPTADQFAAITTILGLVNSSGQAPELIDSFQQVFDRPNVAVLVSEEIVRQTVSQDVNETSPVNDCILGTRIIGQATLTGLVTADLVPSADQAMINVTLLGNVTSRNRGYNGPVRLRTEGYGEVTSQRMVSLDSSGLTLHPTTTSATLNTNITSIEHHLRLVRKIARRKAAEQKPKADRIALAKLRHQVGERFAEQTRRAVATDSPDLLGDAREMLYRLDLTEPEQRWSTTEDQLNVEAVFRRDDQLSAVTARPKIDAAYDVALQLHESALDNAFAPVLAGRTLREEELNELLAELGQEQAEGVEQASPDEVKDEGDENDDQEAQDEPPFVIDFARLRPVIFEARGGTLRVGVRGTRFVQGNRELRQSMEITAVYEPVESDGVTKLVRQGEVDVDFPGNRRLTVSQAGLRRTIQRKFGSVFPAEVLNRTLEVPVDAKIETLRGRQFQPRLVQAANGWLTIAVR